MLIQLNSRVINLGKLYQSPNDCHFSDLPVERHVILGPVENSILKQYLIQDSMTKHILVIFVIITSGLASAVHTRTISSPCSSFKSRSNYILVRRWNEVKMAQRQDREQRSTSIKMTRYLRHWTSWPEENIDGQLSLSFPVHISGLAFVNTSLLPVRCKWIVVLFHILALTLFALPGNRAW